MESMLEDLPDEILLIICRYLSKYSIVSAFFDLNTRLNRTISQFTQSLVITADNKKNRSLLSVLGRCLRSLTLNYLHLSSSDMTLTSDGQELTFLPGNIPHFEQLTTVNIITGPDFKSIDILFSHSKTLRCVYIASSSCFTIPKFSSPKISTLEYLTISLRSADDLIRLLIVCPRLIYLNVTLSQYTSDIGQNQIKLYPSDSHAISGDLSSSFLREFHLGTRSNFNITFDQLKSIFMYLPFNTIEHLGFDLYTQDLTCVDGQLWETYLVEHLTQLKQFECLILLGNEDCRSVPIRIASILPTFRSAFWSAVLSNKITGYYTHGHPQICIHTEVNESKGRRRRYCWM